MYNDLDRNRSMTRTLKHDAEKPFSRSIRLPTRRRRRTVADAVLFSLLLSTIQAFVLQSHHKRRLFSKQSLKATPVQRSEQAIGSINSTALQPDNSQSNTVAKSSGWTSTDQLAELKETVDIVSVVESYGLERFQRKDATRATAICPFHNDRNPSLSIDGPRRLYKCFACGAGGDVFHFVREYSKLQGESMTFHEAIRHVSTQFGDGSLAAGTAASSRLTEEERQELKLKKERIRLANAAAAAYYTDNLKKPFAGPARQHLLARRLTASAVRAFALGYAPDAYFGSQRSKSAWGEGSLVSHLGLLNFTADEMIEAGLAIRPKRSVGEESIFEQVGSGADQKKTNATLSDEIMDRFRGRLVVPIFDSSGRHVLGFGGRILDEHQQFGGFEAPKYLNSPETAIFEKKKILFGHSLAEASIRDSNPRLPLLVVEGYLDAITLWTAGFKNVVASMGTAISSEQLSVAARLSSLGSGRVILCLDNDEAGTAAVHRLCRNGMLTEVSTKCVVEIQVASLPEGIKDPADFIEAHKDAEFSAPDAFLHEVVNKAQDWTDWFIQQLLSEYNPSAPRGGPDSFGDIFNRIADFLATSMGSADRTKKAFEAADTLALLMARDANKTDVSSAARRQLESDLIDKSSRIANAREATQRRADAVDDHASSNSQMILSTLSKGQGPSSVDDAKLGKLSKKARAAMNRAQTTDADTATVDVQESSTQATGVNARYRTQMKRRGSKTSVSENTLPSLTPHFSGFDFVHKSDVEWLSLTAEKGQSMPHRLTVGKTAKGGRAKKDSAIDYLSNPEALMNKLVYFNSNDYHGHQFLTQDAATAGYSRLPIRRDPSILAKGVSSLLTQDTERMRISAEDALLQVLVRNVSARATIENILDAKSAVSTTSALEWTAPEKAWLFDQLVSGSLPDDKQSPLELKNYLLGLVDTPTGAFSPAMENHGDEFEVENSAVSSSKNVHGVLDPFFLDDAGALAASLETALDSGTRPALLAEDLFGSLLFATTADKATRIRRELSQLVPRIGAANDDSDDEATPPLRLHQGTQGGSLDTMTVDPKQKELVAEFHETMRTLQTISESNQRMTSRLVHKSATMGREAQAKLQADLFARLDEHLAQIGPLEAPETDELYHSTNNEPYEDALERMDREWGVWARDDIAPSDIARIAGANTAVSATVTPNAVYEGTGPEVERESLEEALARMDREWAAWTDEADDTTTSTSEAE